MLSLCSFGKPVQGKTDIDGDVNWKKKTNLENKKEMISFPVHVYHIESY